MDSSQEEPLQYKIYVKLMKTVDLDVKCTDTVDQIKSKIGAIEGIDNSQQALFFAGNHLQDDKMLSYYNILGYTCVDLYVTDGMQIAFNIPSVGKIINLNLKKSQSVANVKAAIKEMGGIPLDEEILLHDAGRELEDGQMLSQCGLTSGQTVNVLVYPNGKLRISVDVHGERTRDLDVKSWYTVADVKLIENLEGLPSGKNVLGRTEPGGVVALEDTETLQNLHVRNNDILVLYQNIQFFIGTLGGKTLTMSMRTCDTTDEVTKKVEERLGMKRSVFYLEYEGRVMCLGNTLQINKVGNNSTIHIWVMEFSCY